MHALTSKICEDISFSKLPCSNAGGDWLKRSLLPLPGMFAGRDLPPPMPYRGVLSLPLLPALPRFKDNLMKQNFYLKNFSFVCKCHSGGILPLKITVSLW